MENSTNPNNGINFLNQTVSGSNPQTPTVAPVTPSTGIPTAPVATNPININPVTQPLPNSTVVTNPLTATTTSNQIQPTATQVPGSNPTNATTNTTNHTFVPGTMPSNTGQQVANPAPVVTPTNNSSAVINSNPIPNTSQTSANTNQLGTQQATPIQQPIQQTASQQAVVQPVPQNVQSTVNTNANHVITGIPNNVMANPVVNATAPHTPATPTPVAPPIQQAAMPQPPFAQSTTPPVQSAMPHTTVNTVSPSMQNQVQPGTVVPAHNPAPVVTPVSQVQPGATPMHTSPTLNHSVPGNPQQPINNSSAVNPSFTSAPAQPVMPRFSSPAVSPVNPINPGFGNIMTSTPMPQGAAVNPSTFSNSMSGQPVLNNMPINTKTVKPGQFTPPQKIQIKPKGGMPWGVFILCVLLVIAGTGYYVLFYRTGATFNVENLKTTVLNQIDSLMGKTQAPPAELTLPEFTNSDEGKSAAQNAVSVDQDPELDVLTQGNKPEDITVDLQKTDLDKLDGVISTN